MMYRRWNEITVEQMNPLVTRQAMHCDSLTIARLALKRDAVVPRHHHPNEQITNVLSGRLLFVFDDDTIEVASGESLQIPSGIPHQVLALEDSEALDVFTPTRQDWISGEDAYLRSAPATR